MGCLCCCFRGRRSESLEVIHVISPFVGVDHLRSEHPPPSCTSTTRSHPSNPSNSMSQPLACQVEYEVDPSGYFYSYKVSGEPAIVPEKPLWSLMVPALHPFYKALHRNVCSGVVEGMISFRWFCDTPTTRIEMVMVVERIPTGAKYYSCTLGSTPHNAAFMPRMRFTDDITQDPWAQCCQCLCFKSGVQWLTPGEFYHDHLEELQAQVPVTHVLCPACVTQYAMQSEQMRTILQEANVPLPRPSLIEASLRCAALVVDDDPISARVVAALLSALRCSAEVETSSLSAMKMLTSTEASRRFELLVVDYVMPEVSGAQLIRAVRSIRYPAFIVGISGSASARAEMTSAGADIFLFKPIRIDDLAEALETMDAVFSGWAKRNAQGGSPPASAS